MPARHRGSLRRTTHVDVGPAGGDHRGPAGDHLGRTPNPPDDSAAMVVRGAGHEVRTDLGGRTAVVDARAIEAAFDGNRCLVRLIIGPEVPWASNMVGQRSGRGFRRALADATPPEAEGSLVTQLLDDLPAALLISGYSAMRLGRLKGVDPGRMVPPDVLSRMTDLCSGWRSGGVVVKSIALGRGVPVQDCPPSTDLEAEDPAAWHSMPILEANWMRRRRCIDASPGPGGRARVWGMFRDTVAEHDGVEVVLHEYSVSLTIEPSLDGVPLITTAHAVPAVLPFPECPAAAAAAAESVVGSPLAQLPQAVPELLQGVRSCTHLNDLLRSIGGAAPAMVETGLKP